MIVIQVRHLKDETRQELARWFNLTDFYKNFYINKDHRTAYEKTKGDFALRAPFEDADEVRQLVSERCGKKGKFVVTNVFSMV